VWLKGYGRRLHPLGVTTLQCTAGLIVLGSAALLLEGAPQQAIWSSRAIVSVLYLAIGGSVVAFGLNYWLLARMDPSAMLMMGVAEVPIAILLGVLVLGERLPSGTLAGAACVLAAVLLGPMARPQDRQT
jgi:drug/metabolite transporter (DMT)-like permease